jgi:hypothetical protein
MVMRTDPFQDGEDVIDTCDMKKALAETLQSMAMTVNKWIMAGSHEWVR